MLHPHLRLPVEAGLLCLLLCPLFAVEQLVKITNRKTEARNNI